MPESISRSCPNLPTDPDNQKDVREGQDSLNQALETIMSALGLKNNDLVKSSTEQLTHKMVAKARKGRPLTPNVQMKILNALNACQTGEKYTLQDLFTSYGR